jgi:putative DNA primase/helicase
VLAFIREKCEIGPGKEIETKLLFEAWCEWCKAAGRKETGTAQSFARDLRAACSGITTSNTTRHGIQVRVYKGIELK